jgi:Ankyrin repeats (3 copies)
MANKPKPTLLILILVGIAVLIGGYYLSTTKPSSDSTTTEKNDLVKLKTPPSSQITLGTLPIVEGTSTQKPDVHRCTEKESADAAVEPESLFKMKLVWNLLDRYNSDENINVDHLFYAIQDNQQFEANVSEAVHQLSGFMRNRSDATPIDFNKIVEQQRWFENNSGPENIVAAIKDGTLDPKSTYQNGQSLVGMAGLYSSRPLDVASIEAMIDQGVELKPADMVLLFGNKTIDINLFKKHISPADFKQWFKEPGNIHNMAMIISTDGNEATLDYLSQLDLLDYKSATHGNIADALIRTGGDPKRTLNILEQLSTQNIKPSNYSQQYLTGEQYQSFVEHPSPFDDNEADKEKRQNLLDQLEQFVAVNAEPLKLEPPDDEAKLVEQAEEILLSILAQTQVEMERAKSIREICLQQSRTIPEDKSQLTDAQQSLLIKQLEQQGMSDDEIDRQLASYSKLYVNRLRFQRADDQRENDAFIKPSTEELNFVRRYYQMFKSGGAQAIEEALANGDLMIQLLENDFISRNLVSHQIRKGDYDTLALLSNYGLSSAQIMDTYLEGNGRSQFLHIDDIKALDRIGVDLNPTDKYKKNLFFYAIKHNKLDIAKYLVKKKINIDPDPYDYDALDHAIRHGNQEAIDYLLELGFPLKPSHQQFLEQQKNKK